MRSFANKYTVDSKNMDRLLSALGWTMFDDGIVHVNGRHMGTYSANGEFWTNLHPLELFNGFQQVTDAEGNNKQYETAAITAYWLEHYATASGCKLCNNSGRAIGDFCICPNGQAMRYHSKKAK